MKVQFVCTEHMENLLVWTGFTKPWKGNQRKQQRGELLYAVLLSHI